MVKTILHDGEEKMKKAVEVVRSELSKIRSGKATTVLLDGIKVDYYGSMTPLSQIASVSIPDVHTIAIQPWEKTMLHPIEKAIIAANLGFNPSNDGTIVRVPIPPLNEERRRDLVKLTKKFGEDGKVSIRNIRRDAIEHLKKSEKEEHFSEDERKRGEQQAQQLTDKYIAEIDKLLALKEKEIMEV
ncbi:MAG: ribosome recycling factor [Bacteroidota bacterium]